MAMLTHYCGALFGQGTCVVRCWDGQGGTGKGPYQVPINSLVIPVAVLRLGILVYMSRHKQKNTFGRHVARSQMSCPVTIDNPCEFTKWCARTVQRLCSPNTTVARIISVRRRSCQPELNELAVNFVLRARRTRCPSAGPGLSMADFIRRLGDTIQRK